MGEAGTVTMDVSVVDLLRGVMPGEITLDHPTLTLRFDKEGGLLTRMPASSGKDSSLPTIHIAEGQVTLHQEGRPEMVVRGVRADTRVDGERVTLTGVVSDPDWGEWSLEGSVDVPGGSLTATLKTDRVDVTRDKLLRLPVVPPTVWNEVDAQGRTSVEFTYRRDAGAEGNKPLSRRSAP